MRRRVRNNFRTKSRLNMSNIRSDKMSDIKSFYGWTEHQLEQNVRAITNEMGGAKEQTKVYDVAYGKKE